jgi:hypothetical protein
MKKLAILNLSLIIYLAGLFASVVVSFGAGAIMVIMASLVLLGLYLSEVYKEFKSNNLLSKKKIFLYTIALLVTGTLFLQGYSISIGHSLLHIPAYYRLHGFVGILLLALFAYYGIMLARDADGDSKYKVLTIVFVLSIIVSAIGFLGFARILSAPSQLIFYSFVFLTFYNLVYFVYKRFKKKDALNLREKNAAVIICLLMLLVWLIRWQFSILSPGIWKVVFNMGIVAVVILPLSIFLFKQPHYVILFALNAVAVDIYFLNFDRDFNYLVDAGLNGCPPYETEERFAVVHDPGISLMDLLAPPTRIEIDDIKKEWREKDFIPRMVTVDYAGIESNRDSIKVISHMVGDRKHYGLVRIPAGLNPETAPILLALHGGGAEVDVLQSEFLYRLSGGQCRDVLNRYITIAPSFRGDLLRGNGYCFRSDGYSGDVWLGAAEDATSFLEVVDSIYGKEENTVVAWGISRGATVALIVGSLTDKIDHIISISTHTDFLNEVTLKHERVGEDYPKVFYTPQESAQNIRRKIIASSPYYFAKFLPDFEIHQGTEDELTTARHAQRLEARMKELTLQRRGQKFYFYEGHGHGYDDDAIVCQSLRELAIKKYDIETR